MRMYQVIGSSGMYSDAVDWVVGTFHTLGEAEMIKAMLNDHVSLVDDHEAWWHTYRLHDGEPMNLNEHRIKYHMELDPWFKGSDRPHYDVVSFAVSDDISHFMRLAKLKHTDKQRKAIRSARTALKRANEAHNDQLDAMSLAAQSVMQTAMKNAQAELAAFTRIHESIPTSEEIIGMPKVGKNIPITMKQYGKSYFVDTETVAFHKSDAADEIEVKTERSYLDTIRKPNRKRIIKGEL